MLSRILISSNICELDPRVGLHGIKIIRRLRELEKRDSSTEKDLFQLMTLILSNSRVVYYPVDSSKEPSPKPNTVSAYFNVPPFLFPENSSTHQRRFRKMLFCFSALLSKEAALMNLSNWNESSLWMFELIDAYLAMGRTSKWIPHAWIVCLFSEKMVCVSISLTVFSLSLSLFPFFS